MRTDWCPFEELDGFQDEPVLSCFLGKLFHFWEMRNVWGLHDNQGYPGGPNWRITYPGYESFCYELSDAKHKISRQRKRGSRWGIAELPVVVISGETSSLVVGEINTGEPLSKFIPLRKKLLTLQDHGLYFKPHSENSVFRIVCQRNRLDPAELPFYQHSSKSSGGSQPLTWEKLGARQDLDLRAVLLVISSVNKRLQREAHRG